VALYMVYRARNASTVETFLRQVGSSVVVGLWALDRPAPALQRWTLGSGGGAKFELLNRLMVLKPRLPGSYVVVGDDDVFLQGRTLGQAVRLMQASGLDLAMPAHSPISYANWSVTYRRWTSKVRRTGFVEIGPLTLLSPQSAERLLPFPDDVGMGWGLELEWRRRLGPDALMGVLDSIPMVHCVPAGSAYDREQEEQRLSEALGLAGLEDFETDVAVSLAAWRPWRAHPPWGRQDDGRGPARVRRRSS
jgi:hypothetical protein